MGDTSYYPITKRIPVRDISSPLARIMHKIVEPTLAAMRTERCAFRGLLYAGLMLTPDGPKVVEFNCRFGDPETEALMPLMDSSLLELIASVAGGGSLASSRAPDWKPLSAVTTVVAAEGYPGIPRAGDVITGADGSHLDHGKWMLVSKKSNGA